MLADHDRSHRDFLYPNYSHPEPDGTVTGEGAAWYIHQLHAKGNLVMDDSYMMNLAIPPQRPGGEWVINGQAPN